MIGSDKMDKKEYAKEVYEKLLGYVEKFENEKYGQGRAQKLWDELWNGDFEKWYEKEGARSVESFEYMLKQTAESFRDLVEQNDIY